MTIIKYNLQELPPAILNKSLRAKQAFLSGYTSAINRGLTDDESYFSGLSQATAVERTEKAQKQPLEPIKPKVPQHVAMLLEKRSEVATALPSVAPRIKQEFLGKNALVPDSERSLVSATWDKNGRLLLQFDDGQKIVTDPVPVSENIEQYVSISAGSSSGASASTLDELTDVQITNPQQDQVLAYNASTNIWENKAQQAVYTDVTLQKTAAETASTSINFSNRLQQGEIVVSTTSVLASPSGLTILDITNTSTNAVFKIVGGTLLQGYQIDITVLTSLSNSLTARIYLLII
ncbi:hypothetical protein P26059A_0004 [Curvibacter phage P26059A]|nr:hypothetical protein P26059A_0004 [Curvibacter phage P26059A]